MSRRAKFKTTLPGMRGVAATVYVDRGGAELVRVRPLRRKRTYDLRLCDVAEMVVWYVTKAELIEKRKAKAAARKARRS